MTIGGSPDGYRGFSRWAIGTAGFGQVFARVNLVANFTLIKGGEIT
jgi:hypothetical protein